MKITHKLALLTLMICNHSVICMDDQDTDEKLAANIEQETQKALEIGMPDWLKNLKAQDMTPEQARQLVEEAINAPAPEFNTSECSSSQPCRCNSGKTYGDCCSKK